MHSEWESSLWVHKEATPVLYVPYKRLHLPSAALTILIGQADARFGSILSIVLSMHFGFSVTLLVGLVAYLAGAAVIRPVEPEAV